MQTGAEAIPFGSRRDRDKSSSRREKDRAFVDPLRKDEEKRGTAENEREMGKQKELGNGRAREKSEKAERADKDKAASTGASSSDDDNDSEGGSHVNHNLASASSALQGLLRKLGAKLGLVPLSTPPSHQTQLQISGKRGMKQRKAIVTPWMVRVLMSGCIAGKFLDAEAQGLFTLGVRSGMS